MRFLIAPCVLAFLMSGCVTRNTVTEEDRQGIDVLRQIIDTQQVVIDQLEIQVEKDLAAMTLIAKLREQVEDAAKINAQLLDNFKPPHQPAIYAHAELPSLLDRMKKSHDVTFWGTIGAAILGGGAFALGLARKYGKFIPGFGPVFAALDSTLAGVEGWMNQKKAEGNPEVARELAAVLQYVHLDDKVDKFVESRLEKVKVDLTPAAPIA